MRHGRFPTSIGKRRTILLNELGYSFDRPSELAAAVRRLSDFYITQPKASTPWDERWAQAAYLAYFLPLNYARARAVAHEAARTSFFLGLRSLIDFGSGLGSAQMAIHDVWKENLDVISVDHSEQAIHLHSQLLEGSPGSIRWTQDLRKVRLPEEKTRIALFSYSLTEISEIPDWALSSEALILIEPSTREDGRNLLRRRRELLSQGFHVYAPCCHQKGCPLFEKSEKDWCHDRIQWDPDVDWSRLEDHLPMKNRTLTFSYLLLRKTPTPHLENSETIARIVGDPLVEKGKTRQMVCRGSDREFLSWFPQRLSSKAPQMDRGDRVRFHRELEAKGPELRIHDPELDLEVLKDLFE